MYKIYYALIEMMAAAVFVVPLLFIYNKRVLHNIKHLYLYTVFAFYLVAVLALVGFPNITDMKVDFSINLIPFVDMVSDFKNACLNIVLFVPLGVFLPILWGKYRKITNTILFGLCMTIVIEIMQIFTFRTTDINDIMTNTLGTIVGYFVARGITKNFTQYIIPAAKNKELYMICGSVIIIMMFAQPVVSSLLWKIIL